MKEKDWNGNKKTTFVTLGASNHSEKERITIPEITIVKMG